MHAAKKWVKFYDCDLHALVHVQCKYIHTKRLRWTECTPCMHSAHPPKFNIHIGIRIWIEFDFRLFFGVVSRIPYFHWIVEIRTKGAGSYDRYLDKYICYVHIMMEVYLWEIKWGWVTNIRSSKIPSIRNNITFWLSLPLIRLHRARYARK